MQKMRRPYEIRQQLLSFSTDELCEIYERLNCWEWDERIGETPDRFYELQNYARDGNDLDTKETYILPYMREIHRLVPVYDLMHHYHTHVLGRTEEQFENWWRESGNGFCGFTYIERFSTDSLGKRGEMRMKKKNEPDFGWTGVILFLGVVTGVLLYYVISCG